MKCSGIWRHPVTGEERTETPDDLAKEVVRRTVALFGRIDAQGGLKDALGMPPGENLLTGLYGVREQEMEKLRPKSRLLFRSSHILESQGRTAVRPHRGRMQLRPYTRICI